MLNLAALRFREALASEGGPVQGIACWKMSVLGEQGYVANASLRAEHLPNRAVNFLYSNASGSGTDRSPLVARFKAISEAMERWAHWTVFRAPEAACYGFDVDPSSTGMAAFPGLFARQARERALMEAAERFNLLHWWECRLDVRPVNVPWPEVEAWVFDSEAPGITVLLHQRTPAGDHAYGHAAAPTFGAACSHAAAEMERQTNVLNLYRAKRGSLAAREGMHPMEQRSLFFATEEGHAVFRGRLARCAAGPRARPKLVFDGEVPGPWSRYADVWRVLYEPPSRRFLSRDPHYFFW
jgi:hypothetical protein